MEKKISFAKKNKFFLLGFILLAIIPIIFLLHPGFPWTHDGEDHLVRIANFYQNLKDGNLIPRWTGNVNKGFGSPILEFIYPLPYYLASAFHFLNFSLVDSTKIVFAIGELLSFIFMYIWMSKFTSRYPALLGAVLYSYAPFRFVDLYIRGDIGENMAFAFIPLTLFFVYQTFKSKSNNIIWGGIALSLLIISHNAISIMAIPFILFYAFFLWRQEKFNKKLLLKFISLVLLGFLVSAFFWIPGVFEGKYTLRTIITKGVYKESFMDIGRLIWGPWKYGIGRQFSWQMGIFQWLILISSPVLAFLFYKKKNKNFLLSVGLIIYCLSAIFLMFPVSDFVWEKVLLLQNFQFPWRFLTITVISTSVLGALLINNLSKKNQLIFSALIIILILLISKPFLIPWNYRFYSDTYFTQNFSRTTDAGESTPIWSIKGMEAWPKAQMEIIDGDASVKNIKHANTDHQYLVSVKRKTLLAENTLYFPGWKITANGNPVNIEFQNMSYRGIMLFNLDKGNYKIEAKYAETRLRFISDIVSLLSIIFIFGFVSFQFVKRKIN